MKTEAEKKSLEPAAPLKTRVQREVIAWMWVALIFFLINGTVGQARVIPSASMENTLLIGDHLIMSRLGYDAGVRAHIDLSSWPVPPIFRFLAKTGKIEPVELLRAFNLGVGMILVVPPARANRLFRRSPSLRSLLDRTKALFFAVFSLLIDSARL
jgi:signal peptidase I